jgi:hypothetical protein
MEHFGTQQRSRTKVFSAARTLLMVPLVRWLAAGLVCLLASCVVSPQPDPPNLIPERVASRSTRGDSFLVVGEPGSVLARGPAVVSLAALDQPALPVLVSAVRSDGSFEVGPVIDLPMGEVRLWARAADERTAGIDFAFASGSLVPAPHALTCLTIEPGDTLELEGVPGVEAVAQIELVNGCGADVIVESVALRAPAAFTLGPVPPTVTTRAAIEVRFTPAAPGDDLEEVLLITVAGAERDRRSITLHGRAAD